MQDIYGGTKSSFEISTGLITRGIKINDDFLIVDKCTVQLQQEIDQDFYIQGGPRMALGVIGTKRLDGEIECPIRIKEDGKLENAVITLLNNAENPDHTFKISTNHVLSYIGLTIFNGGTDGNELIDLSNCIVKSLKISAEQNGGVTLIASVVGTVEIRENSDYIAPPDEFLLGRQLSFADCEVSRLQSDMRTVNSMSISVENDIQFGIFLMEIDKERYDHPSYFGVQSCKWSGSFSEIIRRGGIDSEAFIHGGFMVGEDLKLEFGNFYALIKCPLFKIGNTPLIDKYINRTTEFLAQIEPNLRNNKGNLFFYK